MGGQMMRQTMAKNTNFSGLSRFWGLVLFACLCAAMVHFANRHYLRVENPAALRNGISVITSDDASYLRPALNFLESGEWKDSGPGQGAYVRRSPGYGMIYTFFVALFGEKSGLEAMVFFQLLLWSFAVGAIPYLGRSLGLSERNSWLSGFFVAAMPMFYGFLSYTLTEALTPSLVIFFYTFFFRGIKGGEKLLWISALVLGFAILVRPALILLVLSYLPYIRILRKRLVLLLLLASLPMVLWQMRVHRFTGRVDLHPIYQADAPDLYRPLHRAVWDFHKMTGQSGQTFHTSMNLLWEAASGNVSEDYAVAATIGALSPSVSQLIEKTDLTKAYHGYINVLRQQMPFYHAYESIDQELTGEKELIATFNSFRREYVGQNPFRAWLVVPVKVSGNIIFHSNLSPYLFQKAWRGNFLIEVLRWISFLVHVFIFGMALVAPAKRPSKESWSLLLPAMVFFFYLIFIQRGVEERYMLPFLVPMFLVGIEVTAVLYKKSAVLMKKE